MATGKEFDEWWEKKFGFRRLSNPIYNPLKRLHALGADLDYVFRLGLFFDKLNASFKDSMGSLPKKSKKGMEWIKFFDLYRPFFESFAWDVYLETLRVAESILEALREDARILAGSTLLQKMVDGQKNVKREPPTWSGKSLFLMVEKFAEVRDKTFAGFESDFKEADRKKDENARADLAKVENAVTALPSGKIIFEYGFSTLQVGRRRPALMWETFFLLAISEHLRENSGNPHYWEVMLFLSKFNATRTKNAKGHRKSTLQMRRTAGERVAQLKASHPKWKEHLSQLKEHFKS